jgi:hypothetical protein
MVLFFLATDSDDNMRASAEPSECLEDGRGKRLRLWLA